MERRKTSLSRIAVALLSASLIALSPSLPLLPFLFLPGLFWLPVLLLAIVFGHALLLVPFYFLMARLGRDDAHMGVLVGFCIGVVPAGIVSVSAGTGLADWLSKSFPTLFFLGFMGGLAGGNFFGTMSGKRFWSSCAPSAPTAIVDRANGTAGEHHSKTAVCDRP